MKEIITVMLLNKTIHRYLHFFSIFPLVLALIDKTQKTMFYHISKHLVAEQIFNSLLDVQKCGQTQSLLFDILPVLLNMD